MEKLALFPILLAAASLIAGSYGALHNQISYTVSPDYFFAFKFQAFGIPYDLRGRIGASIVGWDASWWMGLIIGVPILATGLILPDLKSYLKHTLTAFVVIALTALIVGLSALVYGNSTISQEALPHYFRYPNGVEDKVAFARAGYMHNFSYLGGALGIITGCVYLIVARLRLAKRCT